MFGLERSGELPRESRGMELFKGHADHSIVEIFGESLKLTSNPTDDTNLTPKWKGKRVVKSIYFSFVFPDPNPDYILK